MDYKSRVSLICRLLTVRHSLSKKEPGSVMKLFPIILAVIVVAVIGVVFAGWMSNLDKKDQIDMIAREYILRMETKGYLDSEDEAALCQDLQDAGMQEIRLDGTNRSPVGYGNQITLDIKGSLQIHQYDVENLFKVYIGNSMVPVSVRKVSTAKY